MARKTRIKCIYTTPKGFGRVDYNPVNGIYYVLRSEGGQWNLLHTDGDKKSAISWANIAAK